MTLFRCVNKFAILNSKGVIKIATPLPMTFQVKTFGGTNMFVRFDALRFEKFSPSPSLDIAVISKDRDGFLRT